MILCLYCNEHNNTHEQHILHMKEKHFRFRIRENYTCPFCNKLYHWKSYARHVRNLHPETRLREDEEDHSFDFDDNDYNNEDVYDYNMLADDENFEDDIMDFSFPITTENGCNIDNLIQSGTKRLLAECDKNWMALLKQTNVTKKLASEVYSQYLSIIMSTIDLCTTFMNEEQIQKITKAVETGLQTRRTEYMRMRSLERNLCYIPPTAFIPNFRQETSLRNNIPIRVYRHNKIARIYIRQTLSLVLSNRTLCQSFVYPSDYDNATEYSHPFAGSRAQSLYRELESDYIAVRIFMDEFCPVNPLGQASTTNKIMGCYLQILNLPTHLQGLDYIFLVFLALSDDVKDDFQDILDSLLLEELTELENGVVLHYRNQEKQLPVILHSLIGDNLGVHQMCGFVCSFSGHSPCRFCKVNQEQLKSLYEISTVPRKTKLTYDEAISSNDSELLRSNGIKEPCCLNNLRYFHVMDSLCLDMMHDLPLGFLPRFMAFVINSLCTEEGITLQRINNAILSFPYRGSARRNPPQKIFQEHLDDGQIKKITASTMMNLFTMLPLVLKQSNININITNKWWLLYLLFLQILDILTMRSINEEKLHKLEQLIELFLKNYIDEGGSMTVKPHYLLHVPDVIRAHGPLLFHWCMQYEAKHREFKRYAKVNSNHQDLAMTLASRYQLMMLPYFMEMQRENFNLRDLIDFTMKHVKADEVVVYDVDATNMLPVIGKVLEIDLQHCSVKLLQLNVIRFDMEAHAYYFITTENTTNVMINQLLFQQSFPIYLNYVRLPSAL